MRTSRPAEGFGLPQNTPRPVMADNPLNTGFVDYREQNCLGPRPPPEGAFHRWLSVEQIRKMQRMRRQTVLSAMESGELPYERRGRICYARLSDVLLWEERRLRGVATPSRRRIAPELADLAG